MDLAATVLIPTCDHEETLLSSVASALAQTVSNIEIFIVGDGTTARTREIAAELCNDDRVKFFDYAKGPRNGEIHRNELLKTAKGRIVCYLSDDDLWFPNHIESMLNQLETADFASAATLAVESDGQLCVWYCNLSSNYFRPDWHRELVDGGGFRNPVPLSAGAHRLDSYLKLPFGWRTTPKSMPTDIYMWIQFLEQKNFTFSSSTVLSVVKFTSTNRKNWTNRQRYEELERWRHRMQNPEDYTALLEECLQAAIRSAYRDFDYYEESRIWRLRNLIHKYRILKNVSKSIIRQVLP
jgi:glycosyltransferase involved in cell wall biosynthesis